MKTEIFFKQISTNFNTDESKKSGQNIGKTDDDKKYNFFLSFINDKIHD